MPLTGLHMGLSNYNWIEYDTVFFGTFFHRHVVKYKKFIFAQLRFLAHTNFERVCDSESGCCHIYSKMDIGDCYCQIQDQLPSRGIIVPVISASDKTPLTNFLYNQHSWLLYFTIGNIWKDIHDSANKYAWVVVGLMTGPQMGPKALTMHGIMPLK